MRFSTKVALGIDVTDTHVSMVLLKQDRRCLTVLGAGRVPVPEGTVEAGHVVDPAGLARILKVAKRHNHMGKSQAAVSLPPGATLARIVPLDEDDPQRIMQFVAGEVQQYAALSGREALSDFRVLAPARHDSLGRVLIVASHRNAASAVVQTCRQAGSRVGVVEPAIMACARALRPAGQAGGPQEESLLALLKDQTLTLCVFTGPTLRFIRAKHHEVPEAEIDGLYAWVAEEINAVLRFSGVERDQTPEGWSITLVDEDHDTVTEEVQAAFRQHVASESVSVMTEAPLPEGAVVGPHVKGPISATALGLALGLLGSEGPGPCVNLMPPQGNGAKSAERAVLVTSIVAALGILIVILAGGVIELMTKRVNQNIVAMKLLDLERKERTLGTAATELVYVEARIESLTDEYEYLKQIAASHREVDWPQLLTDLKASVPESVQIIDLTAADNTEMLVRGLSLSFEGVDTFVQMLNRSECVSAAAQLQADRVEAFRGLVQYQVKCTLRPKETR